PRDIAALDVVCTVAAREIERRSGVDPDALERAIVRLPAPKVRIGHGVHVRSALWMRLADRYDRVRVSIWKRSKEQRADAAEDRRVDADTEGEAQHRGNRERGTLDQS